MLGGFWEKVKTASTGAFGKMEEMFEEIIAAIRKWLEIAEKEPFFRSGTFFKKNICLLAMTVLNAGR